MSEPATPLPNPTCPYCAPDALCALCLPLATEAQLAAVLAVRDA